MSCFSRVRALRAPRRCAFTLIELMMVVIILGVLGGIVMGSWKGPMDESREVLVKAQLRLLRSQILLYKLEHGDTPPAAESLTQLMTQTTDLSGNLVAPGGGAKGPYVASFPVNPFNGRRDVTVLPPAAPLQANDESGWLYQLDGAGGFVLVANSTRLGHDGKRVIEY